MWIQRFEIKLPCSSEVDMQNKRNIIEQWDGVKHTTRTKLTKVGEPTKYVLVVFAKDENSFIRIQNKLYA